MSLAARPARRPTTSSSGRGWTPSRSRESRMRMRAVSHLITRELRLPPVTTPKVRVERDLAVPMRDGVVLKADRYLPAGHQRAPLVLCRSPYGRAGLVGAALLGWPLAERGFQVVVVSTRGTAGSGGTLDPWNERDDGLDTITWLRAQPWYPGRFATAGSSYLGSHSGQSPTPHPASWSPWSRQLPLPGSPSWCIRAACSRWRPPYSGRPSWPILDDRPGLRRAARAAPATGGTGRPPAAGHAGRAADRWA
jgi:X-Pro dipeptidyl-peptidase (S15 family)